MRWMNILAALLCCWFAPHIALAQSDDRGILQAFLEDTLSEAGREVRITGFAGALSGRATLGELTIADQDGVWLTVTDAVLDWNRAQLLRGVLDVKELSAKRIVLARAPVTTETGPSPQAAPMRLPDLPVSIQIGALFLPDVLLGAPLLGEEVRLAATGNAVLADQKGDVSLEIKRRDAAKARLAIVGSYSNETNVLSLDLDLEEGQGGIASRRLGLPGAPSIRLHVAGDDPLDDFTATLALASDGEERLAGDISLIEDENGVARFKADLGGDLRPLLGQDYHAFLGADTGLYVEGTRAGDGALSIDVFSLNAEAMTLQGAVQTRRDGWPAEIALTGRIASNGADAVLLAIPGPETYVDAIDLRFDYSAARLGAWQLAATINDLKRDGTSFGLANLSGSGFLLPDEKTLGGSLEMSVNGLSLVSDAMESAVGDQIQGQMEFDWQQGMPFEIKSLALHGDSYQLDGKLDIAGIDGQIEMEIDLETRLAAENLSRFQELAGVPLTGAAELELSGQIRPVSGAFAISAKGTAQDIDVGVAQLAPYLKGETALEIKAIRDAEGLLLERLRLDAQGARFVASGSIKAEQSEATFLAELSQFGGKALDDRQPLQLSGALRQEGETWQISSTLVAPGETEVQIAGTLAVVDGQAGEAEIQVTARSSDMSPFAAFLDAAPSGAVFLSAQAQGHVTDQTIALSLDMTGEDLAIGQADLDRLLSGTSRLRLSLKRDQEGTAEIERFDLATAELQTSLAGRVSDTAIALNYEARLRELGVMVSGLTGAAELSGSVSGTDNPLAIEAQLQGPGGANARISGTVNRDGTAPDIALSGAVPLGLANRFVSPNIAEGSAQFDLQIAEEFALSGLRGVIRTEAARFTVPTANMALENIQSNIEISNGQARIGLESDVAGGGKVSASGQVALTAPFQADLGLALAGLVAADPGLYETTVDGQMRVSGALASNARVGGQLNLGETEVRIPDGFGTATADLPGLIHQGEPRRSYQTRVRAGLVQSSGSGTSTSYPLDISVSAPARIFVRGRGLDAEFAGALRLTGTTADVIPQGRFDLIRGRLDILGKRLELDEAYLQMQGDFDPYIRAVAVTTSGDSTIQITVEGQTSSPTVSITSSPELPEEEVLARLLFERDITQISALQALQLANAIRVLAGNAGEGVVGRLRRNFGLDDLDIATSEEGEAGLRAGKYINENAYMDVSVDTSGRTEINLNLSLSPSVTLRGSAASDGETGVGLFFERDY